MQPEHEVVHEAEGQEGTFVHSTKRPLTGGGTVKETKRQRKEKQEEALLQKAISCMEAASNSSNCTKDADTVFGDYIASELRDIQNVETKRWLKHQIQSLIYQASTQLPFTPMGMTTSQQLFCPPAWDYLPRNDSARGWITNRGCTLSPDANEYHDEEED